RHSRAARHRPCTSAAAASSQAAGGASSLASTASGAARASISSAASSQRDGRQSMRQGADPSDEGFEFGVIRTFVAEEPFPEPIVLAVQQPQERRAFGGGGIPPSLLQPALEQPVQLAHAAPAAPAQAAEFGVVVLENHRVAGYGSAGVGRRVIPLRPGARASAA